MSGFDMAAQLRRQLQTVDPAAPRTIETVTEEILTLKRKTVDGFLEIGRRLNEAKGLLGHGEWLPWLETQVQFSERTAQKFMALAREYEGNPQLAADLGSEKAFALLALPAEEREKIAAEGATVEGKTKAAADLTTREVKQIVAERKEETTGTPRERAELYLIERAAEDLRFRDLLRENGRWMRFAESCSAAGNRAAGIDILKNTWRNAGGGSANFGYRGSPKGLSIHGREECLVERTWTEVWDCLAVIALQDAAKRKAEPEGQLMISGWMPGGTNPGHPCVCAVLLDFRGDGELKRAFYRWTGKTWWFDAIDEEVAILPEKWMEMPETEGLE